LPNIAIDSASFIRKGAYGTFKACTGVALTINNLNNFEAQYFRILDELCSKYKVEKPKVVLKGYDIHYMLGRHAVPFCDELFSNISSQFSQIDFYYTYFPSRISKINMYGTDGSAVEEASIPEFINKITPSYPHLCAWKYLSENNGSHLTFHIDNFEGEITKAWNSISDKEVNIYFKGDEMYPSLAMADIALRVLDNRLRPNGKLKPEDIFSRFCDVSERLRVNYLGQKDFPFITPIKRERINVVPNLKRPLIFILKEAIQGIVDENDLIKKSPLWLNICEMALSKRGSVKFIDQNSKEDRALLNEGGIMICLGDAGFSFAQYLKGLGFKLEIMRGRDLL
jgi:hypothetical protein